MAIFDDTQWLLSHIQNSYATSDDSGLSEVVLQGSWPLDKLVDFPFLYPDDSIVTADDYEQPTPHSLDVHSDQSYIGHRFRSDTEHRLDKLKREKTTQAKITRIIWQPSTQQLAESEAEELFGVKPVVPTKGVSQLAELLDQDDQAQNPYLQWAKWDASTDVNLDCIKRLHIFMYTGSCCPAFPVRVVAGEGARVVDVIGLACFLHTRDGCEPPLLYPPSAYSLRIADEDGSVEWALTALHPAERIDKFGFRVLAVTTNQAHAQQQQQPVTVTVHISGGVFSLIECESRDIQLREVLNRTIAKRREMARIIEAGVQYHLEKAEDEPGHELDLERTLADVKSLTLHAVRDNSKRADVSGAIETRDSKSSAVQTFPVTWVKKWAKFEATLEVSRSCIYMSVTGNFSGGLLRPPHPVSYPSDRIGCCNLKTHSSGSQATAGKKAGVGGGGFSKASTTGEIGGRGGKKSGGSAGQGGGKCEILLTCQGEQRFKDYILECEESAGQEIVDAIKAIKTCDLSSSNRQTDEEKPRRRYSLAGLKKKATGRHSSSNTNNSIARPPPPH